MKIASYYKHFAKHIFCMQMFKIKRAVMISSFVHGVINYIYSALLITSPWLFGFNVIGAQTFVADIAAATVLTYSMFTRYQLSFSKSIPMKTHLLLDVIVSIFLIASPWLFGFADKVYLPHVLFGAAGLVVVLLSSSKEPESVKTKIV